MCPTASRVLWLRPSSNLIGVIIPSLSNIVFPEVLRGISAALEESGFQAVVGVTNYNLATEESLVRSMLAWKPAAMIIAGFEHTEATRRMLEQSGIRIAELMDIDSTPIDIAVGLSHRRAGYDTGQYLIATRLSPLWLCRARLERGSARAAAL